MIIAAFSAAGKSCFCNQNKSRAIDFVCMPFKYTNFFELSKGIEEGESIKCAYELELRCGWETGYCEAIQAMEKANPELYIVIPPVNKVLELLKAAGIRYTIIYPKEELLEEYIERCRKRGNTEDFIDIVKDCWDFWIKSAKTDEWADKIELSSGQYMSDVIKISDNIDCGDLIVAYQEKYLSENNRYRKLLVPQSDKEIAALLEKSYHDAIANGYKGTPSDEFFEDIRRRRLELTHERRKEIDAILKRTEQEIAEGKIQYTPWREYRSELLRLSKRDKAKEKKKDGQ